RTLPRHPRPAERFPGGSMTMALFWLNLLLVAALATAMSLLSRICGMKSEVAGDKALPYETGMPPLEESPARVPVLYYRYAVLFVVFDVDLAFLVPWVLLRDSLTLTAMVS